MQLPDRKPFYKSSGCVKTVIVPNTLNCLLLNVLVLDRLLVNHFKLFFIAEVLHYYKQLLYYKTNELVFLKETQSIRGNYFRDGDVCAPL